MSLSKNPNTYDLSDSDVDVVLLGSRPVPLSRPTSPSFAVTRTVPYQTGTANMDSCNLAPSTRGETSHSTTKQSIPSAHTTPKRRSYHQAYLKQPAPEPPEVYVSPWERSRSGRNPLSHPSFTRTSMTNAIFACGTKTEPRHVRHAKPQTLRQDVPSVLSKPGSTRISTISGICRSTNL
ncbi:hypothetical protein BGZ63DRAFT_409619 [Mariannaea sp. PMI_226]|nr:hypothetical protein BGZ63DRAFT_409619 [Mariannaea sp. PMI_226]